LLRPCAGFRSQSGRVYLLAAVSVLAAMLAACGGGGGGGGTSAPPPGGGTPTPRPTPTPTRGPPTPTPTALPTQPSPPPNGNQIKHVVVIIQENRSFDNLFSGFPGADGARSGVTHTGQVVPLRPWGLEANGDIDHDRSGFVVDYANGAMNGFDLATVYGTGLPPNFPYAAVPQSETSKYWTLAARYTLADRMFASVSAGSYPQHQYLISAQSADVVLGPNGIPWGCDAPPGTRTEIAGPGGTLVWGPFPCFSYPTLHTLLEGARLGWRFYAPGLRNDAGGLLWSAFDSIQQVRYGPDWAADVVSPETQVLNDIPAGRLAAVTWVVPSFINSDHARSNSTSGPDWVGSIVNAVGGSSFWNSTAIFIVWDDWGGWYDHVNPPQLDYLGLGFRVPLLVVSPYAKHGYVSHVLYEYGSIVKFIEWNFGLQSLHSLDSRATDARANDLFDCFDFAQSPSPYVPLAIRRRPQDFFRAPPDRRMPDEQ
jgi:phospholipase C